MANTTPQIENKTTNTEPDKTIQPQNQPRKVRAYKKTSPTYRSNSGGRGSGDCWQNSNNLYNQLTRNGEQARIIQYSTSQSSRHRSVQVYKNGEWTNYNYKKAGYKQTYYATSNSKNGEVIKSS